MPTGGIALTCTNGVHGLCTAESLGRVAFHKQAVPARLDDDEGDGGPRAPTGVDPGRGPERTAPQPVRP